MTVAIKIESISKQYRLGEIGTGSLAHDVNRWWHRIRGKEDPYLRIGEANDRTKIGDSEYVWALRDVSFDVRQGEVVGIIGRNGAGKSTLLKILSRVTSPTTGTVKTRGRIASLLEVGTGFHPELTGRENIYLNGTILGMRKREITRKLDEIIDFSGCERYIDTPVKRYSSGMYVRLAFAVAAHLDPEIMVVDEVLAVGDMEFQKKCLNKLQTVSGEGRTVLFVSHNMSAITRLCPRAILINAGSIEIDSDSNVVTSRYLTLGRNSLSAVSWEDAGAAPGNDVAKLLCARICDGSAGAIDSISVSKRVGIEVTFEVLQDGFVLVPNFPVHNEEGICAFHLSETDSKWFRRPRPRGKYVVTAWLPPNFLAEGVLSVGVALSTLHPLQIHFYEPELLRFCVTDPGDGSTARGDYMGSYPGVVRPKVDWETRTLS